MAAKSRQVSAVEQEGKGAAVAQPAGQGGSGAGGRLRSRRVVKAAILVIVGAGVMATWWGWTDTWPVVAVVGGRPITRFEVDRSLFSQYGQSVIDGLITQKQIRAELDRQNIRVDDKNIDQRIEEIKKSLGEGADFEQELKSRGLNERKLRELIELQLRLAKAVEGKSEVAADEVIAYVKANGKFLSGKSDEEKRAEAEGILRQEKANAEIEKWVEAAKNSTQVWRLYPVVTPAGSGSGARQ